MLEAVLGTTEWFRIDGEEYGYQLGEWIDGDGARIGNPEERIGLPQMRKALELLDGTV